MYIHIYVLQYDSFQDFNNGLHTVSEPLTGKVLLEVDYLHIRLQHVYIYIYIHIYVYSIMLCISLSLSIYIYIERERCYSSYAKPHSI